MTSHSSAFATPIPLNRDTFMRQLISSLGHLNESILGSDIAGAYIMNVGLSMGAAIEQEYKGFWEITRPFTVDEYAHVIVDLKQRINGNFSLVAKDAQKVVVRTTSCPFDDFVRKAPSLCFMTSSVFGGIAARNFGYAKVALHRRIALGDPGCYVTVFLEQTPDAKHAMGREYFPDETQASPDIAEQLKLMDSLSRLRRKLGESDSRWEEVVRGAAEAITVLSPDHTIVFANARWRELLGVEGEELVGHQLERLMPEDEQATIHANIEHLLTGQRFTNQKWRLQHRNGSWRYVTASAGPIRNEQGGTTGALVILHDITEETEAQRIKDHFLTSASHELRTPVTTIRALTDLLLRTLEKQESIPTDLLTKRLLTIRREADRLAFLGVDLVDAARLQRGRLEMKLTAHDLNELVAEAVVRQRELLDRINIHTLTFHAAPEPLMVHIEPQRIQQVLDNLLSNAVKYSPDGGEIVVRAEHREMEAVVSVTDPGIGIPVQDTEKIFTPFYRSSISTSQNYSGLGLGLYLSRELVEAHQGTLAFQSIEGEGSTFMLSLPLQGAER